MNANISSLLLLSVKMRERTGDKVAEPDTDFTKADLAVNEQ